MPIPYKAQYKHKTIINNKIAFTKSNNRAHETLTTDPNTENRALISSMQNTIRHKTEHNKPTYQLRKAVGPAPTIAAIRINDTNATNAHNR
jgi:hypothetical protein